MRLVLLNPNTSKSVTDRIASAARSVAGPETKLVPVTAPKAYLILRRAPKRRSVAQ